MPSRIVIHLFACLLLALPLSAQQATSTSSANSGQPQSSSATAPDQQIQTEPMAQTPVYRVNVVERTARAVDYRERSGTSELGMRGTSLEPQIKGDAKVTSHTGRLAVELNLHNLKPASDFGPVYLTYVAWAVTPEGRAVNLGEVVPNDDHEAHVQLTTSLQTFGVIVTAEPYFAVTRPSDMVVAENVIPENVKGWPRPVEAKFETLQRGEYAVNLNPADLPATHAEHKKVPLALLEARNAVAIAQAAGASQYASDTLSKATDDLNRAEDYLRRKQSSSAISTVARAAAQAAEDARLLAIDRKQQAQAAAAKQQMQQRIQSANTEADAARERAELARMQAQQESVQRAQAEQERQAAEREAELARQDRAAAQQELQQAEQARQQAEQQRQQLAQQAQQANQQAQQAQQRANQVEQASQEQRARLIAQLNQVLQTRETARGVVSQMPDVLFATNQATLRPDAKIKLAKVAGIIMAYPDLKLEIDGFTDSTGTQQRNEVLSQQRAAAVRDFLISQGVPVNNVVARGFGESNPIASNGTAEGRQLNRRVEMVVSGTAIGLAAPPATGTEPSTTAGAGNVGGVSGAVTQPAQTSPATTNPAAVGSPANTQTLPPATPAQPVPSTNTPPRQ